MASPRELYYRRLMPFVLPAQFEAHLSLRSSLIVALGFRTDRLPQLKSYLALLWAANEELNLISRKMTWEELIDNHVVDCLLPLTLFPRDIKHAADFGSGGGLPGVLYAIQFPEIQFSLYEKSPKKREFLESCKKLVPNLSIHPEIPKAFGVANNTDLVTARAFKPLDVILELSREYYKSGGKYFLLKGRREKIEEEIFNAKKSFRNFAPAIHSLQSPLLDVERNLVRIPSPSPHS